VADSKTVTEKATAKQMADAIRVLSMDGVEKALAELLRKRMSRVAKLATTDKPRGVVSVRGLFIFFADFFLRCRSHSF
jgi:hypothetical protein